MGRGANATLANGQALLFGRRTPRDDQLSSFVPGPQARRQFDVWRQRLATDDRRAIDAACQMIMSNQFQLDRAPLLQALLGEIASARARQVLPSADAAERAAVIQEWTQRLRVTLDHEPLDLEVVERLDVDETNSWLEVAGSWGTEQVERWIAAFGYEDVRLRAWQAVSATTDGEVRDRLLDAVTTASLRLPRWGAAPRSPSYAFRERARALSMRWQLQPRLDELVVQTKRSYHGGPLHLVNPERTTHTVCGRVIPCDRQQYYRGQAPQPWGFVERGRYGQELARSNSTNLATAANNTLCHRCADRADGHPSATSEEWLATNIAADQAAFAAARQAVEQHARMLPTTTHLGITNADIITDLRRERFEYDTDKRVRQASYRVVDEALVDQLLATSKDQQQTALLYSLPWQASRAFEQHAKQPGWQLPDRGEWLEALAVDGDPLATSWFGGQSPRQLAQLVWQRNSWDEQELHSPRYRIA
jgi:hypothetical protein